MKFGNPLVKFKLNDHDLSIIENAIVEAKEKPIAPKEEKQKE